MSVYREPGDADVYLPAAGKPKRKWKMPKVDIPWEWIVLAALFIQAPIAVGVLHDVNTKTHEGLIFGVGTISCVLACVAGIKMIAKVAP